LSQKAEHMHTVINCQNTWFVNNLALFFVCCWSNVYDIT